MRQAKQFQNKYNVKKMINLAKNQSI